MKKIALLLLALAVMASPAWATNYYVKADGGNDEATGQSWDAAFKTIEKALSLADANNIYVAKGEYTPTDTYNSGLGNPAPLSIVRSVEIYGGFAGTETTIDLSKRDLSENATTITCPNDAKVYLIGITTNPSLTIVIDGFTLTKGKTAGEGDGGGIYISNDNGTVTVRNCVIKDNEASLNGGGMYVYSGTVNVINCVFDNNNAGGDGGGMYINNGANAKIDQCSFTNNKATGANGGTDYKGYGGALKTAGTLTLTNSTFTGNSAPCGAEDNGLGGAVYITDGSPDPNINYCTFVNNTASKGADIYADKSLNVKNSLIWNTEYATQAIGYNEGEPTLKVTLDHCAVSKDIAIAEGKLTSTDCVPISGWTPVVSADVKDKDGKITHRVFRIEDNPALSGLVGAADADGAPTKDQLGRTRSTTAPTIGAVEFTGNPTLTASATAVSATYGIATFDPASITFTVSPDKLAYAWSVDGNSTSTKGGITATLSDGTTANSKTLTFSGAPTSEGEQEFKVKAEYTTGDNTTKKSAEVTVTVNVRTYTLTVTAPTFTEVPHGYTQPAAQAITIKSTGNSDATISSVALSGANPGSFTLTNGTPSVTAKGTNTSYTIQPNAGLAVGTYTATITVTYNGGATATATVEFSVQNAGTVTKPAFDPVAGEYIGARNVTISCTTDGATIYYTTDGTDPRTSSTKSEYQSAIPVTKDTTLKAFAVKEGMTDSNIAEAKYTITAPTYTLNVENLDFGEVPHGYAQPAAQAITIKSTGNSDATISSVALSGANPGSFTLTNGTPSVTAKGTNTSYTIQPNAGLAVGTYTATITVTYNGGATATATVEFSVQNAGTVTKPAFDPVAGEYIGARNVTISCTTDGATIYYTTDGTDPRTSSTKSEYQSAIPVTKDTTLKAFAVKAGMTDSNIASAAYTITVPSSSVTGVSLNKTELPLAVDGTEKLKATVEPDTATNKNVSWSSDDPSIATVAQDGTVTGKKVGTATITVTTEYGSYTAKCIVTVTATSIPVTGVTLNTTWLSLAVGGTETLTATVKPTNATNKAVTWTSSNTSVATVNNGVVKGVTAGMATITVTTVDGGHTAKCTVTVTKPESVPESEDGIVKAQPAEPEVANRMTLDKAKELLGIDVTEIIKDLEGVNFGDPTAYIVKIKVKWEDSVWSVVATISSISVEKAGVYFMKLNMTDKQRAALENSFNLDYHVELEIDVMNSAVKLSAEKASDNSYGVLVDKNCNPLGTYYEGDDLYLLVDLTQANTNYVQYLTMEQAGGPTSDKGPGCDRGCNSGFAGLAVIALLEVLFLPSFGKKKDGKSERQG